MGPFEGKDGTRSASIYRNHPHPFLLPEGKKVKVTTKEFLRVNNKPAEAMIPIVLTIFLSKVNPESELNRKVSQSPTARGGLGIAL